jgi:hypothetical protein
MMETTIRTKQYGSEIILPNLTSEAGAKTYGPPCIVRTIGTIGADCITKTPIDQEIFKIILLALQLKHKFAET